MQLLITHGRLARTRVMQLSALQIVLGVLALAFTLMMLSGAIYHFVFLKAAREGWPLVSQIVRLVVRDEIAQRDRFMRENLDAMAQKVGEMQAKLVRLEAMSDRVSGLAGLKPEEVQPLRRAEGGGKGGPYIPMQRPSLEELQRTVAGLDEAADWHTDLFTFSESRLFQARFEALRVPSAPPVEGGVGSGFGFRTDPITGRAALHTGLDFPAEPGTAIVASAGGVVLTADWHPEYGHTVEVDHGNGLVTRYAHCLQVLVKPGQVVKRGQQIAEVGSSGRSTGPHLHFEVLVQGVPQDPARFLAAASGPLRPPEHSARR
jgi:murein DD-endopeptidase MepM/ murein hydrolase activator NlpD